MKRESHKVTLFMGLPRQGWFWLFTTIVFSAVFHLISLLNLDRLANSTHPRSSLQPVSTSKVTVRIVEREKLSRKPSEFDEQKLKRIVESQLKPTVAPEEAKFAGAQDHKTPKETRAPVRTPLPKAADPGLDNMKKSRPSQSATARSSQASPIKKILTAPWGKVASNRSQTNPTRQAYEALMPRAEDMNKQVSTGYQDYVDENLEIGDRIDLNTNNFRYLSYFTSIRKALDLVWVYPSEAVQRGLQGEAKVEFTISKDGRVERIRVVDGSGHKILDEAVIEAIKLAGPFAPLPVGWQKEKLTVVGSFRYVLSSFAGAL